MKILNQIFAGDSATWKDSATKDNLGNTISAPDWTLKYVIAFPSPLTLTASQDGTGWTTTISKVQSAVVAGEYFWQAYAEKNSDRVTLGSGRITIKAAAGTGVTGKSQAEQDLDAVQAAMRAIISGGAVAEYAIGGRSLRKTPMADLMALEAKLKAEIARERKAELVANGLGNPSNVYVRFRG